MMTPDDALKMMRKYRQHQSYGLMPNQLYLSGKPPVLTFFGNAPETDIGDLLKRLLSKSELDNPGILMEGPYPYGSRIVFWDNVKDEIGSIWLSGHHQSVANLQKVAPDLIQITPAELEQARFETFCERLTEAFTPEKVRKDHATYLTALHLNKDAQNSVGIYTPEECDEIHADYLRAQRWDNYMRHGARDLAMLRAALS
ncbi:hypothetical protein FWF48_04300 [Candidatus Saccharibacteria bacterium]|nr:hypothetical protein [Candidatus Saccharibacteria bacterium]